MFLACADLHIRDDLPRCRTDADWMATQAEGLFYLVEEANKNQATLIIAGDIFHRPSIHPSYINMVLKYLGALDKRPVIIPGNHDLPYHRYINREASAYGIVEAFVKGKWGGLADERIGCVPFGQYDAYLSEGNPDINAEIVVAHHLVFPNRASIPPGVTAYTPNQIAGMYPLAEVVIVGDYHLGHHIKVKREDGTTCLVVVPGCLNRQVADMADARPGWYLIEREGNHWEASWRMGNDIGEGVVTDTYLRKQEAAEDRIAAFAEAIDTSGSVSLSFEDNVNAALATSDLSTKGREAVLGILEGAKK